MNAWMIMDKDDAPQDQCVAYYEEVFSEDEKAQAKHPYKLSI